jgi:NAD(P)-dependent dehydrogenase (short-subunit alcohol dehydrogenase family)
MLQETWETIGDAEVGKAAMVSLHLIGRLAEPGEQAKAALFLISEDASYVTGHLLMVDGGYSAR